MKMTRVMMGIFALFLLVAMFFANCEKKVTAPDHDNPLDAANPATSGDPFQLRASISGGGVTLTWNAVNISSLKGYHICRSETGTGSFVRLASVLKNNTYYIDRSIQNGHNYWYKVIAYDNNGKESSQSNVAAVRILTDPMIVINGGAQYTATRQVNLTILATTAVQIWVSNNAQFSEGNWESYKTSKSWTLPEGEGTKTVFLKAKYSDGTISNVSSDTIEPQPMQPSIIISDGSTYTSTRNVTLKLSATGENLRMKVSEDSSFTGISWETFATTKSFTLTTGEGSKAIYARFKNDFEMESKAINGSVILDTTPPIAAFSVSPNAGITNETTFNFDATASSDNIASVGDIQIRWDWDNDGNYDTEWTATKTATYKYLVGGGEKTIKLAAKDGAGNTSITTRQIFVNTRPVASFTATHDASNFLIYHVNASSSFDFEDGTNLEYRWDWENDGIWDTGYSTTKTATHQYSTEGTKTIKLEVRDTKGLTHTTTSQISVQLIITDIDGNTYKIIKIGDQWWMAENLKVTRYRNGEAIPHVTDDSQWANLSTGAYCNYGNNTNNATTYGRLYNWYAVIDGRKIAPAGWHVPTDQEWETLVNYLGGSGVAGGKMKEAGTAHWSSPNTGGTNESGLSARPGGRRYYGGYYEYMGVYAYFWSSSVTVSNYAWARYLHFNHPLVYRCNIGTEYGFSVRCVRD